MSRSYRKSWMIDRAWKYWGKRFASKRVRRSSLSEDLGQNSNYKKHFQQYDICDYKIRCTPGDDFYDKSKRK